jgi:hypothetical protein
MNIVIGAVLEGEGVRVWVGVDVWGVWVWVDEDDGWE